MVKATIYFDNGATAELSNVKEIKLRHVGCGVKERFDLHIDKIGSDKNDTIYICNRVERKGEIINA